MTSAGYRHAIWPPSPKWPDGLMFGASTADFAREFPSMVKELGPPLRVWNDEPPSQGEDGN